MKTCEKILVASGVLLLLFSLRVNAQKLPPVNFDDFSLVIDSADLAAMQNSSFIKDSFAAVVTRTTKADNGATWTGTYLEGLDNSFEIFDSSGSGDSVGTAAMVLNVDGIGELSQLDSVLSQKYKTQILLREKQMGDKKIPWFTYLIIQDSLFDSRSHISVGVLEYKPGYFDYNHWTYTDNKLTRYIYLHQYEQERKNKLLKRFTGIAFKTTDEEKDFYSRYLLNCGYTKMKDDSYRSPENFIIRFVHRNKSDRYAVAFAEFESSRPRDGSMKISDHIKIEFRENKGRIIFE